jgi:Peptidase family M23.
MRSFYTLLLFLIFFGTNGWSQDQSITVKSEFNKDNSVSFRYEKKEFGTFYLRVNFKYLENANSTGYKGNIDGFSGNLFSIKPIDSQRPISFSYNCTWIRGKLNPRIDTGFVYLLPVSKGKNVNVLNHSFLYAQYFGAAKPKNWKSFKFKVSEGDTVFSARKGIVVDVNDGFDPDTSVIFASKANAILIEHEDGSLARYSVLKKGSIMVKPGQTVFAHAPLAIGGTYNNAGDTQIDFLVYYLSEDDLEKQNSTLKNMKHYCSYIDPVFHTTAGDSHLKGARNYSADYGLEHLTKELTKRERKKFESVSKLN